MTSEQIELAKKCVDGSLSGEFTFPEIVGMLAASGVERYHADFCRQEITYYWQNGDSVVVPVPHAAHEIGMEFQSSAVAEAIQQSQRNEHTYPEFIRKTMTAGCVGYFVQITGRRCIYFGRCGESHVELFPTAPPESP